MRTSPLTALVLLLGAAALPAEEPPTLESRCAAAGEKAVALRELPRRRKVEIRIVDRKQHALDLVAETEKAFGGKLEEVEAYLARFGLIPQKLHLRPALTLFASQNVGASYDNDIVRVFDADIDDATLVHEMTHALQHQNFAASAQAEQASGLDAMLAFQALLEGDAEFTESVFLHPEDLKDPEACARRIRADTDAWEQQIRQSAMMTPMVLSRSQAFWYTRGQEFVHSLHRTGGWNAVNRAWGAPPASTEQVLHPGKYAAREYPVRLDTSGIEARLIADGWAIRYSTTAGELVLEIWLETRSPAPLDVDGCFKAAAGWGGDRAILAERGKTRLGVWVTTWDAPEDAAEFAAAAAKTLPPDKAATDSAGRAIHATADGRHAVLRRGRDVLVLLGCPEETLPGIEDEAWKVPHLDEVERK